MEYSAHLVHSIQMYTWHNARQSITECFASVSVKVNTTSRNPAINFGPLVRRIACTMVYVSNQVDDSSPPQVYPIILDDTEDIIIEEDLPQLSPPIWWQLWHDNAIECYWSIHKKIKKSKIIGNLD